MTDNGSPEDLPPDDADAPAVARLEWQAMSAQEKQATLSGVAEKALQQTQQIAGFMHEDLEKVRAKFGPDGVQAMLKLVDGITPNEPAAFETVKERLNELSVSNPELAAMAPAYAASWMEIHAQAAIRSNAEQGMAQLAAGENSAALKSLNTALGEANGMTEAYGLRNNLSLYNPTVMGGMVNVQALKIPAELQNAAPPHDDHLPEISGNLSSLHHKQNIGGPS